MDDGGIARSDRGDEAPIRPSHDRLRRDPIDLRDRYYDPPLRRLPASLPPDRLRREPDGLLVPVRDQGQEDSCVAQALAALVDILRLDGTDPGTGLAPASARMERVAISVAATGMAAAAPTPRRRLTPTSRAFWGA